MTDKKEPTEEKLVCSSCGKQDETVALRKCGYAEDVHGTEEWETVCDDCEHEHLMDI